MKKFFSSGLTGVIVESASFADAVRQQAIYVLPETRSAREVFGFYEVEEHAGLKTASQDAPIALMSNSAATLTK